VHTGTIDIVTSDDALLVARALVLHDLEATRAVNPESVSALEEAVTTRRWWASQWEEGKAYVAGLVAQDVQDALAAVQDLRRAGPARALHPSRARRP
jgi:hypothetical protein